MGGCKMKFKTCEFENLGVIIGVIKKEEKKC